MHKITYTGDGVTTEYFFSFPYFQSSDIYVSVNSEILTSGQCTVIPSVSERVDGKYTGGRVVLSQAPSLGAEIRIWRKINLSRVIDYQPTLPISTDCLNADFNFILEYMRDIYELDGDIANLENGLQFLDSIQYQIEQLGDFSQLVHKDEMPDFTTFVTKDEIPDTNNIATKDDIPDISNLATKDEIPDISNLATKDEIPNISNLATKDEIPDISNFATKDEIPDVSDFASADHTHNMSEYATVSALNNAVSELQDALDDVEAHTFPITFDSDDNPDVVVKSRYPSAANNYTWYRVYKSGWVEQGGRGGAINNGTLSVTLPITMANTNYFPMMTNIIPQSASTNNYGGTGVSIVNPSKVQFATSANISNFVWMVIGFASPVAL